MALFAIQINVNVYGQRSGFPRDCFYVYVDGDDGKETEEKGG